MCASGIRTAGSEAGNNQNVGERCNAAVRASSFSSHQCEKKYDEVSFYRPPQQVEDGALVIDVNMDDVIVEAKTEMIIFLEFIMSEPGRVCVPIMIDSFQMGSVIEADRRSFANQLPQFISLKEGEEVF